MTRSAVDYGDVQGLVRYGYAHMTEARFLLSASRTRAAARAWLRAAPVTTATRTVPRPADGAPGRPHAGRARGAGRAGRRPAGVLRRVPCRAGRRGEPLTPAGRRRARAARRAGSGAGPGQVPHADGPALCRARAARALDVDGDARSLGGGVRGAPEPGAGAPRRRGAVRVRRRHQPAGAGLGAAPGRRRGRDQIEYSNVLALGEVLLGYPNEYGKYTDRPLRRPERRARRRPPPGRRRTRACATWAATAAISSSASCARTPTDSGSSCAGRRTATPRRGRALAEAMVGRALTGDPLPALGGRPIPGVDPKDPDAVRYNQFTFDADVHRHAVPARRPHPARQPAQRRPPGPVPPASSDA